jgi:cytochrome c556
MCHFFSCIAMKDGRLLFTEDDSHEEIIRRAGLRDNDLSINRPFVRLEITPPFNRVTVDEDNTLPEWWDSSEFTKKAKQLAKKVGKVRAEYQTKLDAVRAEYQPKRDAVEAEYQPKRDAVEAEYQTKLDAVEAEYQPKRDAVRAEYQTKLDAVRAEYQTKLAPLHGYLPAKK